MTPNFRKLVCLLLLTYFQWVGLFHAQLKGFGFQQELQGIENPWHKIELPNHLFGKIKPDFSDIRVIGITSNHDTIEAPFLLRYKNEGVVKTVKDAEIINSSKNENGYYVTLAVSSPQIINQLELSILQENYDWRIAVEGSQNQQEWFTLVENYRILSISNEETHFSYSTVHFEPAQFAYYRIHFNSSALPSLSSIRLIQDEQIEGNFRSYGKTTPKQLNDNQLKMSYLNVDLKIPLWVNAMNVTITDTLDFYRPYTLFYAHDSIQTKEGWEFQYTPLSSGVFNSLEENKLTFSPIIARHFKIEIENKDNKPLTIESIETSGLVYEMIIRFEEDATYYLCYGNEKSLAPEYDLAYFESKIPAQLTTLQLGELVDTTAPIDPKETQQNWEINSIWLWIIMIVIILTLGWFSFNMIKKME